MSWRRLKILTTTITRAAFAEKMKQVAEEGLFVEYKRINDYWKNGSKALYSRLRPYFWLALLLTGLPGFLSC
jgi:hypothetical protein